MTFETTHDFGKSRDINSQSALGGRLNFGFSFFIQRIGGKNHLQFSAVKRVADLEDPVHFYDAGIELTATLKVGDKIHIKGHTTDLEMDVDSMQIDNEQVAEAKAGDSIGVKVDERVRSGDTVYKVTD